MIIRSANLKAFLVLSILAPPLVSAVAAGPAPAAIPAGVTRVLAGPQPAGSGGGSLAVPRDEITDAQRETIREMLDASILHLHLAGKLAPTSVDAHPLFGWPLRMAAGLPDPGYHGISNFVDLNLSYPGAILDYNCGPRSYDTDTGYNHSGTDIYTWPWTWLKMDRGEVEIVAAAPGQIIYKNDGNYDRSCATTGGDWNAVYVQHADGSVAWYGHMKSGSPTAKQVGETVIQGEYLGVVGSSGNSTGPHLHFEVHDTAFNLIEPWSGPCNWLNTDTWWQSQRPYYDSAVNRVTTGDQSAEFLGCPIDEIPHSRATFPVGAQVYFTTYYHDQLGPQVSTYTIYRPDGTIYAQWLHSSPAPHFSSSWWWWSYLFPAGEMQGTWRFTVEFEGTLNQRLFSIGSPAACGSVPETPAQGEVLRVQKNSTLVRLTWGASCNPAETDYVIYEGAIGNFASHARIACSTGGNRVANIAPGAGGRYFLVGARNADREGSLGLTSSGAERPVGTISCFARSTLQCP